MHWKDILRRIHTLSLAQGDSCPVSEMYERYLEGHMSFDEMSHTLDEILFTSIDVTTVSCKCAVVELARHLDIQRELLQEISEWSVDDTNGATVPERMSAYVQKSNTLLHAIYLESGRLNPILCESI